MVMSSPELNVNGSIAWGSSSGAHMFAGGTSHLFAYSIDTLNVLYSGGANGLQINNQADTAVLMSMTDSGAATFSSSVTATNFIGAGTGLTGTASALSIGGNAYYSTYAGTASALTSMLISQFTNDAGYITSTSSTFSYTASVTLSPTWQNTGVSSANLTSSGVYIVTCNANDFGVGG